MSRGEAHLGDVVARPEHQGAVRARRGPRRRPAAVGPGSVPTEDDARIKPQRSAVRVIDVEATSCSPASALTSRSVLVSAMPGRTTVVPKRERKPSAAAPQRLRAWERSWRHASTSKPCPPPSLTMAGRSGTGAMLATSSRANSVGDDLPPFLRAGVDGVADLAEGGHDERGELPLVASRGTDVEGVGPVAEGIEVELRCPGGLERAVGAVGGQHA